MVSQETLRERVLTGEYLDARSRIERHIANNIFGSRTGIES